MPGKGPRLKGSKLGYRPPEEEPGAKRELSWRECSVVGLLLEGHGNKEVAYRLGLTEGTVKVYISGVFRKLGVRTRSKLILRYIRGE